MTAAYVCKHCAPGLVFERFVCRSQRDEQWCYRCGRMLDVVKRRLFSGKHRVNGDVQKAAPAKEGPTA